MIDFKNKISKNKFLKLFYKKLKRVNFEFRCVIYDLFNILATYRKSNDENIKKSNIVFVCSLPFYREKKWQVVSQADLWYSFVREENALICGSFISYWLFGRNKEYVIGLEPKYSAPKIQFLKSHKKVFAFISDSHSKEWLSSYIEKQNITDILTPYKKTLIYTGFYKPLDKENVHSLPWCVADQLLDNVVIKHRNNEVLGFGNTGGNVYDLRSWTFDTGILASFNYAGSGNKKFSGDAYYYWLRGFDACVVAMSTHKLYNYTVAKFFEVPSQGLLLFAFETDDFDDHGFIDGKNCIKITKENFLEKIELFRNSPENYIDIRKQGYDFIKSNHTVSKRLEQIKNCIER